MIAANAYMQAGGARRYVAPLIKHFREKPLSQIDQDEIDKAAITLYPHVVPATQNCYVYTPVSAILHHALGDKCPVIRRPKGAKGKIKTDFLWPADAFAIIAEADSIDPEFGLYLRLLIYTGIRKSEGLNLLSADVQPAERAAWLRTFRFNDGGHFKHLLLRAKLAVCGLPCPVRRPTGWAPPKYRLSFVGFHTFRHTWATRMRRYGGTDVQGLVGTGNWRDPKSAARYAHVVSRDEWARVDNLPGMGMHGERPPMAENLQSNQPGDFSPPRAGRTPFCTAVGAVLSGPYARPCGKPGNLHIPAGFEVP